MYVYINVYIYIYTCICTYIHLCVCVHRVKVIRDSHGLIALWAINFEHAHSCHSCHLCRGSARHISIPLPPIA